MSLQAIPRTIGAPLGTAVTAGVITAIMRGTKNVQIGPLVMSAPVAVGLTMGLSSGITEYTKNQIVPLITSNPIGNASIYLVQPAITGASAALLATVLNAGNVDKTQLMTAFATGVIAQLAGNTIGQNIDNLVNSIMPKVNKSTMY